jgi:hypothetical protein
MYIRRWRPSEYTFDEIQEVVLSDEATVAELKAKVSRFVICTLPLRISSLLMGVGGGGGTEEKRVG